MATVDSLEITLETRFEKASTALNGVVKQLGLVAEGISSIGNNRGLNEFARKAAEAVKEFSAMKDVGKDISSSIQPQMQKISKSTAEVAKDLQDKFKDISVKVDFSKPEAELKKFQNQANTAQNALTRILESSTADKQVAGIERWSISLAQATNAIKILESHLKDMQTAQPENKIHVDTTGLQQAEKTLNDFVEQIRYFDNVIEQGGEKTDLGTVFPVNALKTSLAELKRTYPEAEDLISSYQALIERAQAFSPTNQFKNATSFEQFERSGQNLKDFREQLKQLQIPKINEENLVKLQNTLEKTKEKMALLKTQMANKLTMGKITEDITDKGYRNLREQIALTGKTIDALQEKIKTLNSLSKSEKPDFKVNGIEETRQQLKGFAGELQRMGNLISKTLSDINPLKGGEMYRYLFDSVKTYKKNAQIMSGKKVYTDDYKRIAEDVDRAKNALEKLERKKRDLQAAGLNGENAEWQRVSTAIAQAEARLNSYKAQKREMEMTNKDVQPSGNFGQRTFQNLSSAMTGIISAGQKVANTLSTITSGMARLAAGTKNAISKFSNLAKSFIGIKSSSKKMNNAFSQGFKALLRYGLGIRSVYALLNKLRTAMKEAFQNLSRYSSETNASLSMLKSSLFALKNSLAVAFDPIVNVIAPYLSMFIDLVTRAFNIVGQFFSALTGKATAVQTKKPFMDYAAGLEKTGSAAKKAEKDIKHGLRAFDELNNLTSNEPTSGSGGGGSGATEILPEDMFTTVTIESDISDFAEKIKAAWEMQDFTEVGGIVGEKLKNALDGIDMTPVQERAEKIGASLGTFLNGVVETDGLADSIGRTIGEAINTGVTGINNFLDNTHWDSVGIFIGDGLNEIVNTVDWEDIGHLFAAKFNAIFEVLGNVATTFEWSDFGLHLATSANTFINDFDWAENGARLGTLAKGFLDTLISFLENTEWQELGNGIADFIGGIDWGGILKRIAEGVGAALGGFAALLWGLIEDAWNSVVTWWGENAFEDGKFVPEKLFAGIGEALVNIGTWIKENIAIPFLDGLSKAFGLDVSGSELFEMGTNIIFGVFDGIIDTIKGIGTWIYDHVFRPFVDGFKAAFQIHSPSKVMEEQGNFIMQGLLDGINALVQRVVDVFNNIKQKIVDVWDNIKSKTTEIWTSIKTKISDTWSGIKTSVSDFTDSIKDVIKNAWQKVKSTTEDIWDGIKNAIKSPINGILGFINGLIEGVEGGLNRMIRAVNGLHFDLPDWLPIVGGKTLGFTIPEISVPKIPLLAKGGIAMDFTPAIIGEAGREAVLPLTNPRSMGMIADSILDNASYATYANGSGEDFLKKIEEATYRGTMRAIEAAGGIKAEASFKVEGDRAGIFKVTREEARDFYKRTRRPAFEF